VNSSKRRAWILGTLVLVLGSSIALLSIHDEDADTRTTPVASREHESAAARSSAQRTETNHEALVFGDPLARIPDDPSHPHAERREIIVGHSTSGSLPLVRFTERRAASSASVDRHATSAKTMKQAARTTDRNSRGDMSREYRFDYSKSRSNRFAKHVAKQAVVVVLDPDVAKVFRDPRRVNALLRATIAAVDKRRSRGAS